MSVNMTKIILIYGFLILINAFASRGAAQDELNGKWKLTGYNFSTKQEFPIEKMVVDLTITDNKQIGGRSGCNLYSGAVNIGPGNKIKIGPLTWTERACDETTAEFESRFLDALQNASQYTLKNGVLTISDPKMTNVLRFARDKETVIETPAEETPQTYFVRNRLVNCEAKTTVKCLQIKTDRNSIWHVFRDPIAGFDFKPGRYYKIEVRRDKPANTANQASFYHYRLVRVIRSAKNEKDLYK